MIDAKKLREISENNAPVLERPTEEERAEYKKWLSEKKDLYCERACVELEKAAKMGLFHCWLTAAFFEPLEKGTGDVVHHVVEYLRGIGCEASESGRYNVCVRW